MVNNIQQPGRGPKNCEHLKALIREVPDFPKKGILFYDITTLLKDRVGFATLIDALSEHYLNAQVDAVLAIEARGFIFGPALAYRLNAGFVPIRKPGKLPFLTVDETYELEYGSASLQIHLDGFQSARRILIVDDLLATGGTARATGRLAQRLGGEVVGYAFVIELKELGGRERLAPIGCLSLIQYE